MSTMSWATLSRDVVQAVTDTLSAGLSGLRVQSLANLSDGVQDMPMLRVHWMSDNVDPHGNTDRTVFRGLLKQTEMVIDARVFVCIQAVQGEGETDMTTWNDAIRSLLFDQTTSPFGVTGSPRFQAFSWRAERTNWELPDKRTAVGITVTMTFRIF